VSPLQTSLYFREWGLVRKHYVAQGIDPKLADAKRHELHKKALGQMKSSKAFTNADLDKVLAVFYAITRPADLNSQLRQMEQQTERIRRMQSDCRRLVMQLPKVQAAEDSEFYAKNYLNTVANSLYGVAFAALDEKQLARVTGTLRSKLRDVVPF